MIKPWEYKLDSLNTEILLPNAERKGTCYHCVSTEEMQDEPCPFCNGTGTVTQSIKVKAEVQDHNDIAIFNRSTVSNSVLLSLQRSLFYELTFL